MYRSKRECKDDKTQLKCFNNDKKLAKSSIH